MLTFPTVISCSTPQYLIYMLTFPTVISCSTPQYLIYMLTFPTVISCWTPLYLIHVNISYGYILLNSTVSHIYIYMLTYPTVISCWTPQFLKLELSWFWVLYQDLWCNLLNVINIYSRVGMTPINSKNLKWYRNLNV